MVSKDSQQQSTDDPKIVESPALSTPLLTTSSLQLHFISTLTNPSRNLQFSRWELEISRWSLPLIRFQLLPKQFGVPFSLDVFRTCYPATCPSAAVPCHQRLLIGYGNGLKKVARNLNGPSIIDSFTSGLIRFHLDANPPSCLRQPQVLTECYIINICYWSGSLPSTLRFAAPR